MEIYVRKNVILLEQNMLVNYQPIKFYTVALSCLFLQPNATHEITILLSLIL